MRSKLLIALLPMLAGCPYIFGAADLSNVGDSDPDTDATETDPPDTDDTDDTDVQPNPDRPTIVSSAIVLGGNQTRVSFSAVDPNQDFLGGHLTIAVDGVDHVFDIPDDVPDFNPATSNKVTILHDPLPCTDFTHTITMSLTDFAGNTSDAVAREYAFHGFSEGLDVTTAIGTAAAPFIVCGTLEGYTDDQDLVTFDFGTDNTYEPVVASALTWPTDDDIDIHLNNDTTSSQVGSSAGTEPFELIVDYSPPLTGGVTYQFDVFFFHGFSDSSDTGQASGGPTVPWQLVVAPLE